MSLLEQPPLFLAQLGAVWLIPPVSGLALLLRRGMHPDPGIIGAGLWILMTIGAVTGLLPDPILTPWLRMVATAIFALTFADWFRSLRGAHLHATDYAVCVVGILLIASFAAAPLLH